MSDKKSGRSQIAPTMVTHFRRDELRSPVFESLKLSATRLLAGEKAHEDGGGAADALVDLDGPERAVFLAGAAFHAPVPVGDPDLVTVLFKYPVGADLQASAATGAFILIVPQRHDIF
jgi:hypothetical protein